MKKRYIVLMMIIVILLALVILKIFDNKTKEEKIEISLPFSEENEAYAFMPMGETINHPGVVGHSGIDFFWLNRTQLIACVGGVVTAVETGKNGLWLVKVKTGDYMIEYGSMDSTNPKLKKGSKVKKGDFIGYPMEKNDGQGIDYMTHWSFGTTESDALGICPLNFFDNSSRERIESIWANTTTYRDKQQFPDICNGIFKNINSIEDFKRVCKEIGKSDCYG
jgi:hypothetical protein